MAPRTGVDGAEAGAPAAAAAAAAPAGAPPAAAAMTAEPAPRGVPGAEGGAEPGGVTAAPPADETEVCDSATLRADEKSVREDEAAAASSPDAAEAAAAADALEGEATEEGVPGVEGELEGMRSGGSCIAAGDGEASARSTAAGGACATGATMTPAADAESER